jgi:hypothetical protein
MKKLFEESDISWPDKRGEMKIIRGGFNASLNELNQIRKKTKRN